MAIKTNINGVDYELATTLRVAYKVQGQHNHKPYAEVFKDIGNMGIEEQIDILYAAFECANADAKIIMPQQMFRSYYLDNVNLKELMEQLQAVIRGITGDVDESESQGQAVDTVEGN